MTPTQPPGLRADERELPPLPAPVTHTDLHGFLHTEQQMQEYALQARAALTTQPAEPSELVAVPLQVLEDARAAIGNFCMDHGWGDEDMQAGDNLDAYIDQHKARLAALAKFGGGR